MTALHDHPKLTEPAVREHVVAVHGWSRLGALRPPYFAVLVAHHRAHREAEMRAAS